MSGALSRFKQDQLFYWAEKYKRVLAERIRSNSASRDDAREFLAITKQLDECRAILHPDSPPGMVDKDGNVR
jgi:hypothetical protein